MNFWVQDGTRQTYSLCSDHLQLIFIICRFQNCKFTNELKFICNIKTNTPCILVVIHEHDQSSSNPSCLICTPQLRRKVMLCLPVSAPAGRPLSSLCRATFLPLFLLLILLFEMTPMCSAKVLSIVPNHAGSYDTVCEENIC